MFRRLFSTFIWIYAALECSFSMPWCFATSQNPHPTPPRSSPTGQPCWWFWPAPPFPSTPQRASCSDKFSLSNNSSCWVPPSPWSWLLGCEVFCPPESEMLGSSADSITKSKSSAELYLAIGTVSAERAGCENTLPEHCKLSNYFFSSNSLQTASNLLIHPARHLKVHFLQRKK